MSMKAVVGGSSQRSASTTEEVSKSQPAIAHRTYCRRRTGRLRATNCSDGSGVLEAIENRCAPDSTRNDSIGNACLALRLDASDGFDHDRVDGHVLVAATITGLDRRDRVDHFHS